MTERRLLAVDLSNQTYRQAAAHQGLTSGKFFTGGLYGFLVAIAGAITRHGVTDIVLCQDMRPYVRSLLYPEYKALRQGKQDPVLRELQHETMDLVLVMADELGLPVWGVPGFESDDLIAHCVRRYGWRFAQVIGMSNDADLKQLLDHPRFALMSGGKSDALHEGGDYAIGEGGQVLTPAEYVDMLCLTGTHNEVGGLDGVGPVRGAAIVKDPVKWRAVLAQHMGMIARNRELIQLPHKQLERDGPVVLPRATKPFDVRMLYRFAGRYDIDVTPRMAEAFEMVLPR